MPITTTIVPIFAVIALGWAACRRGYFPEEFIGPANRLVYYLAIPAMVFRSISGGSLEAGLDLRVLGVLLGILAGAFSLSWFWAVATGLFLHRRGVFIQSSIHGNLGYVGLAVAYYFLGQDGLARASLFAGVIMIVQNLLAVIALQFHATGGGRGTLKMAGRVLGNPIILSAAAGILFSTLGLRLPVVIDRSLKILGDLSLPMALLIIGASLDFKRMRYGIRDVLCACLMKLVLMPLSGWFLFWLFNIAGRDAMPATILLAAPTATVTYIMARELDADTNYAVAVISLSTLISAGTYAFWLTLISSHFLAT